MTTHLVMQELATQRQTGSKQLTDATFHRNVVTPGHGVSSSWGRFKSQAGTIPAVTLESATVWSVCHLWQLGIQTGRGLTPKPFFSSLQVTPGNGEDLLPHVLIKKACPPLDNNVERSWNI